MEHLRRTQPSTPRLVAAIAAGTWLVLGALAGAPAQANGAAGAAAPVAAPPGRFARLVTAALDKLSSVKDRVSIRHANRAELTRQGRDGDVNGNTQESIRKKLAAAIEATGASPAAADRQARRSVAMGGRAALPLLKKNLRETAKALGKVPGKDDAKSAVDALGPALDRYVDHVAALSSPDWHALRRWNTFGARVQIARARDAFDQHLASAIAAQDSSRIAAALGHAAGFRATTKPLRETPWRGAWARTLRPNGKGSPLLEAAQDAFGVERIWGAIEATRDGWLKAEVEDRLSSQPQTLDGLMAGLSLRAIADQIAPALRDLNTAHTNAVTGKDLAQHYWFGLGLGADRRKMDAVIQETGPRALAAMFRGLLTRRTPLTAAEAALIPGLMSEAANFAGVPRALRKELNTLRDAVLALPIVQQQQQQQQQP